jgi:hypothetical protein
LDIHLFPHLSLPENGHHDAEQSPASFTMIPPSIGNPQKTTL